jgi:proline dehydrogenase
MLGEDITSEKRVEQTVESILHCAQVLDEMDLDAAIAVKLTNLGVAINKNLAKKHLLRIFNETTDLNTNIEIDIEGTPLIDFTLKIALECAEKGYHVTLALQAYLNRTIEDIKIAIENDITVRLVKGAYLGDTNNFKEIQGKFKTCFDILFGSGKHFSVGTHDPELVEWIKDKARDQMDLIEFGFLKGIADETKLNLVNDGWAVVEYVPYGIDSKAYITRRMRYLKSLKGEGRKPAP